MLFYLVFISFLTHINARNCPDGTVVVAECNKTTLKCDADPNLGCYEIDGTHYCCAVDKKDTGECMDLSSICTLFTDLCHDEKRAENMKKYCKKTCGFCEKEPKPKEQNGECVDLVDTCQKDIQFCHNKYVKDDMSENCKKTCGFCGKEEECKDLSTFCKQNADKCDTDEQRDTMKTVCPLTCKYCKKKEYPDEPPKKDENECKDIMADCNKYVGRCRSLGYINDLYDMCKATCKFCGQKRPPIQKPPQKKERLPMLKPNMGNSGPSNCVDTNPDCSRISALCNDKAKETQAIMRIQCSKTCNLCETN